MNDRSFGSKNDVDESNRVSQFMCLVYKSPTKTIRFESLNGDESSAMRVLPAEYGEFVVCW